MAWPHRWRNGSVLKTGRCKVLGSISSRAFRPSLSEFSVVFSETRVNTGYYALETPPPRGPGPTSGQLASILQPKYDMYERFWLKLSNL